MRSGTVRLMVRLRDSGGEGVVTGMLWSSLRRDVRVARPRHAAGPGAPSVLYWSSYIHIQYS
jgi:hypothetical protein